MALSYYYTSSVADGSYTESVVDAAAIVTACSGDSYFDNIAKIARVNVYYTSADGRQTKRIVHDAPGLTAQVSWSSHAADGAWLKSRVRVIDFDGAEHDLFRAAIGDTEDLTHGSGFMTLNTSIPPTTP